MLVCTPSSFAGIQYKWQESPVCDGQYIGIVLLNPNPPAYNTLSTRHLCLRVRLSDTHHFTSPPHFRGFLTPCLHSRRANTFLGKASCLSINKAASPPPPTPGLQTKCRRPTSMKRLQMTPRSAFHNNNNNNNNSSRSLQLDHRADRHLMEERLRGCRSWAVSFCSSTLGYVFDVWWRVIL
jgi:hypothetical protein